MDCNKQQIGHLRRGLSPLKILLFHSCCLLIQLVTINLYCHSRNRTNGVLSHTFLVGGDLKLAPSFLQ